MAMTKFLGKICSNCYKYK